MTDTIENLISAAGFSTTYESDRLQALCKLVATVCIDHIVSAKDSHSAIGSIVCDFDINNEQLQ
jgi:hypothetical protein